MTDKTSREIVADTLAGAARLIGESNRKEEHEHSPHSLESAEVEASGGVFVIAACSCGELLTALMSPDAFNNDAEQAGYAG